MGMLVVIRLASIVHRWCLGTCSHAALMHYLWMEVVCILGAFINVYRVPERWIHVKQAASRPHRSRQPLDLIGNSHSIMHVLAVVAMWHIYHGVATESEWVLSGASCPV
jgi:predicted membrane channel-forming protein YqfA (hemolysin III family)